MKVLVVAGASGGHIFPALGFLDALKEKNSDTQAWLVLPKKNSAGNCRDLRGFVKYISIGNYGETILNSRNSCYGIKYCVPVIKFLKGALESLFILADFKPDVVIGFGGLASLPLILLAWLFRINTIIHEQNVIPGKANKFLAIFADKIAVTFTETKDYLKNYLSKTIHTGYPLRRGLMPLNKEDALNFFGLSRDRFTVLVMGGSRGAKRINQEFLKALSLMPEETRPQVIHLSGREDYAALSESYKKLSISAKVFDFLKPMHYAYSAADLVISRSGAGAVSEIIFFRLPAVLLPYPYAYRHQLSNAEIIRKAGAALIIEDKELNAAILKDALEGFIDGPEKLKNMRFGYSRISVPDGADLLVKEAFSFN